MAEESKNTGLVIWLTGLAGSGKSTIGRALYERLRSQISNVIYLDGDELRDILGAYGYDKHSRIEVAKKRSDIAHFLAGQGMVVIVTTISMFDDIYAYNRSRLKRYFEVYIQCDMEELCARDQKGLYSKAMRGEVENVVGVDIDFDKPNSHLIIDNCTQDGIEDKVEKILSAVCLMMHG